MSINHSDAHFKQLIDMMMPDTSLFEGKSNPDTNLYKWHVALSLCLLAINDVVRLGWLDYFIDTASDAALRSMANEVNIPDDIFEASNDIETLRKSLKAKNRIINGVITDDDLREIAAMFGITDLIVKYGDSNAYFDEWIFEIGTNNSDLGLPLYSVDDGPHAFLTIHLPFNLIVNNIKSDLAVRFERLIQRTKSAYAYVRFIYDL